MARALIAHAGSLSQFLRLQSPSWVAPPRSEPFEKKENVRNARLFPSAARRWSQHCYPPRHALGTRCCYLRSGVPTQNSRVLIVDDSVELAENIAEILELEGYGTDLAASAEEALPKALVPHVHVVVTDFRLPGMNGAELVSRVRRVRQYLPFLVISACTDHTTTQRARDVGAQFLPKPIDFPKLTDFISGVMHST